MYIITMTEKEYGRTYSGKSWAKSPVSSETKTITEEQYNNIVCDDTIRFFRRLGGVETVTRGYTSKGYNVIELASTSPCKQIKRVRSFDITWQEA